MKCGLLGHLRMSPDEEAEMTCVPHHLLVRNECYCLFETVPSVSKYYHKYIICSLNLLDKPVFLDSEHVQVGLVFVEMIWNFQTVGKRWEGLNKEGISPSLLRVGSQRGRAASWSRGLCLWKTV